ncbi:hypothetical protein P7K49_008202 [Saguinus oedipus]|uniref:KH-like RNA-binding domain-containing protein n=1 Tax=Saguinus oedipus TaxID=9490 RepID=A0ABQ9VX10_SAGOE|nr:hypothetical protein P7K49_008202 [Saguinus oedipus]
MDTPRRFPTLVQLMQPKAVSFEVLGQLPKQFSWFHSEFLKNPKVVRLEVWLVEKIFGRSGERIPQVQGLSQILIHVNHLDPSGEAEILIFGRPSYQEDTIKMIVNLADYHRQLQAKGIQLGPLYTAHLPGSGKALAQDVATQKAETQRSSIEVREAGTQRSVEVREAGTQRSVEVREAGTQRSVEVREVGTQGSPVEVREAGTQQSLKAASELGTQRSPEAASKARTQRFYLNARDPVRILSGPLGNLSKPALVLLKVTLDEKTGSLGAQLDLKYPEFIAILPQTTFPAGENDIGEEGNAESRAALSGCTVAVFRSCLGHRLCMKVVNTKMQASATLAAKSPSREHLGIPRLTALVGALRCSFAN